MERIKIDQIVVGYHPRQVFEGKEELKRNIEIKGQLEPITVRKDGEKYKIIDGLRRLQATQEVGMETIPCQVLEISEKEAAHLSWLRNTQSLRRNLNPIEEACHLKAMINQFGYKPQELVELGYAGHQDSIYKKLTLLTLHEEVQEKVATRQIGKSAGYHLAKLKDNPETQIRLADEEANRQRRTKSKIKRKVRDIKSAEKRQKKEEIQFPEGDIPGVFFKDSKDMSEIPDENVGLIVTSGPYWAGLEYEEDVSFEEHLENLDAVLGESSRKLMPGGVCCINYADVNSYGTRTGGDPEIQMMGGHYQEILRKYGLRVTDVIHWRKGMNFRKYRQVQFNEDTRHTSYRTLPNVEYIMVCRKEGKRDVPFDLEMESKLSEGEWKQLVDGVWDVWTGKNPEGHPAQFPEEIPRRLIKAYSYPGDIVLDPFLGSGTTTKVARELGRVGVGYERDERYKPILMKKLGAAVVAPAQASADEIDLKDKAEGAESHDEEASKRKPLKIVDLSEYRESLDEGHGVAEADSESVPVVAEQEAIPHLDSIMLGDCLDKLKELPDNSVDQLVTDPPYGLKFMGKDWDKVVPNVEIWKECYRVMKPGAFIFVMAAARLDLQIRMGANLEAAGFDISFSPIQWTHATGFPKASNIAKKAKARGCNSEQVDKLDGAYAGFQPKPAVEPILVAMKPGKCKTYLDEALNNQKGITWMDNCRIPYADGVPDSVGKLRGSIDGSYGYKKLVPIGNPDGRFPANLLISDDVLDDGKKHPGGSFPAKRGTTEHFGLNEKVSSAVGSIGDSGGYSRFFSLDAWADRNLPFLIVPKPSRAEKEMGLDDLPDRVISGRDSGQDKRNVQHKARPQNRKNTHPTVKPVKLMAYLITMGSRPGDTVLDPFVGSGTTAMAAKMLGRRFIGIELSEEYHEIAEKRVASVEAPKNTAVAVVKEKTESPEPKAEREPAVEIVEETPVNQILQGDCFELVRRLRPGSIDLVMTSPPYGKLRNYGDKVQLVHPDEYVNWIMPLMADIKRAMKDSGSFILNIASPVVNGERHTYVEELICRAKKEVGLKRYENYQWHKPHHMPNGGTRRLNNPVEHLIHFCKDPGRVKWNMDDVREPYDEVSLKRARYEAPGFECKVDENGRSQRRERRKMTLNPKGKVPSTVFTFPTAANERGKVHPAPYHEDLPSWFIRALTDEGDTVFDPFAGSGTTCLSAKKMNRKYLGMELNPTYHADALERIGKAMAVNAA